MKDYYEKKAISNTSLGWFKKSPKYFWMMLNKEIDEFTPAYFEKGQQIHMYLLEPEEFNKEYDFLDYTQPKSQQQKDFCESFARAKKGTKDEKLLKAYKSSYSTKENDEKILEKAKKLAKDYQEYIKFIKQSTVKKILPISMMNKLNEIRSEVLSHNKARELLYNEHHLAFGNNDKLFIQNEFPILWKYPGFELDCKSMLDRVVIDHEKKEIKLIDIKTTSHLSEFKDKAIEYRYNRQMAFYWMALAWYFKNELKLNMSEYVTETYIVAISTTEPTEVRVFKVMDNTLNDGLKEIEQIMPELAWHFEKEKWDYPREYYGLGYEIF